jgi:hypothetical protein
MRRDVGSGMITGSIGGVLLWLYDHSFFLKNGAPGSPISDSLLGLLGIASDAHVSRALGLGRGGGFLLYEYLIPLAIMVPAGAAVGALAVRLFTRLFSR